MTDFRQHLARLADGKALTTADARDAFDTIMSGGADLAQMAAFVMAMRVRGETADEIVGGAEVLRAKAGRIEAPEGAIDTCGTGGDELGTYNISTAAAIVTAAAGVPVAKHGNRSVSSKSGSADVLIALGANLEIPEFANEQSMREYGFAFLFAPSHHRAMRHVAPVRGSLKLRTIFNLLGPLANPAGTKRQLLGVFDERWLEPMAEVLKRLGSEHVWVVHGADGLDELTTTAETHVVEMKDGVTHRFTVTPEEVGLKRASIADLKGGDASVNAEAIRSLLAGQKSAYRDIVLLNTGAALTVGGRTATLQEGVDLARETIDSRKAAHTLADWIAYTNRWKGDET
ncbi:anthranilate phosphoribosyltransferase [Gimibacter soli]|uniref:Anthranilate phosphoribosyltransferase n=1 Tax=Gimibacter soli TaxID=3024400 RepID=A0AAE9XPY8_9PROT|nr:anthranilate phosphoribosyltransferase [Gimibacter soli]WCL52956.1 anthranilate phosphoribosyltransferase [Gimibacter soli]